MSNSELSASTDLLGFPPVLDACCGSRMFWFDKQDDRALFVDKRRETWPIDIGTPGTIEQGPPLDGSGTQENQRREAPCSLMKSR